MHKIKLEIKDKNFLLNYMIALQFLLRTQYMCLEDSTKIKELTSTKFYDFMMETEKL